MRVTKSLEQAIELINANRQVLVEAAGSMAKTNNEGAYDNLERASMLRAATVLIIKAME